MQKVTIKIVTDKTQKVDIHAILTPQEIDGIHHYPQSRAKERKYDLRHRHRHRFPQAHHPLKQKIRTGVCRAHPHSRRAA
ncbi:hypothetical protein COI28_11165 [Neisseria meningitidis]|nr:hypothetical protein CWI49_08035 [Neisseria meningitidis]PKT88339.1 hypothetical protein CWI59_03215 [Neisseria meningitidis]RNK02956.1 hypothetical protein COI28_11165 [Neisseria meningitidis]